MSDERYFIIDTKGGNNEDEFSLEMDFQKYIWGRNKFNKVRKNDFFIYRRPQSASENKKFYFFGSGQFGPVMPLAEDDQDKDLVYSHIFNGIEFDTYIYQDDPELLTYDWKFKEKLQKHWMSFFNQYGMTEIKKEDYDFLKNLGRGSAVLLTIPDNKNEADELETYYEKKEGQRILFYGSRYERNPHLRQAAIAIHGYKCRACNFDFFERYGEIGKDFIEVHHTKPLATVKEEHDVNPITDLIPLCPNCHRMIHRRKNDVLSVDELRDFIQN